MSHFQFGVVLKSLPFLWSGLQITLTLTVAGAAAGILLGVLLALMRLSKSRPLSWIAFIYVNLFRSIPAILVLLWFYLLVPLIIDRPVGAFSSALIAFVMFEAAYYAEIIRAGIQSVPVLQREAALSTGLRNWQVMLHVVLPQALNMMTPVMLNQAILLFMDTALVSVIGLHDFTGTASIIATRDGKVVEFYTVIAVVYLCICLTASQIVRRLQKRLQAG
jgi:glutamate/aspartate transport system permease protein